jgi:hypothetical protein
MPFDTYVGASTAVFPLTQDGADPVPPDVTFCPAVVGMHSHPGVTAHAPDTQQHNPKTAPNNTANPRETNSIWPTLPSK